MKRPTIRMQQLKIPRAIDEALWLDALHDQDEALARLVALVYLLSEVLRNGSSALYGAADPGILKGLGNLPDAALDLQSHLRDTAGDLEDTVQAALIAIRTFMHAGPPRWAAAALELERTGVLPAPAGSPTTD